MHEPREVITLRVPPLMKKRIEDAARRDKSSMNQWILAAVREAVKVSERFEEESPNDVDQ